MQKGKILNYFKRLCEIPHCSFETDEMTLFLADFARNAGCDTRVDAAGNIRAVKGSPKICLQAHYDMVCMGEAPRVRAYLDEQGFLRAHNSSLGADNGIGAAIAMSALEEFENIECLFTNNEEVGMLCAEVEFFARSMSESGLERLEFETVNLVRALGFSARLQDRSAPWTPAIGEFAREVASELARINPNVKISAIHAGLECGVLLQKQPDLQACSIGPNIFSPHSVNERCEAASVERIAKAVRAICAKFQ